MQKNLIPVEKPAPQRRAAKRAAREKRSPLTTTQEMIAARQALPLVTLRVDAGAKGVVAVVPSRPIIKELAAEWMYILRNRSRWSGDEDMRADQRVRAADTLAKLGVGEAELRRIVAAHSRHVEVEFHDPEAKPPARDADDRLSKKQQQEEAERRELLDAAAVFPWEFLLSTATREYGRSHALIITRLLARTTPAVAKQRKLKRLLFVESAPGRIEDCYSFDSERIRLRAALGVDWRISPSERIDQLQARIEKLKPEVIHVSGVDNHQVVQPELIPGFYEEEGIAELVPVAPRDGMIVQGVDRAEIPCPHDELAAALVPKANRNTAPLLVTLNLYYSAARIGRDCIRRGAHATLGFLDEIDDELAEYFFQAFFLAWRRGQSVDDLPRAFGQTWELLRERGQHLFGTAIVLWLAKSAFAVNRRSAMRLEDEEDSLIPAEDQLPTEDERKATRLEPITSVLQVDLAVPSEVNYSLLHNARRFLDKLTLSKLVEHALDEVTVMVDLNVGDISLPFRHTETLLNEPQRVLADDVCLPLTAPLLRSLRERVQSTLYVKVAWDGRVAFEQTRSVTLLPVDEWFDDTQKNPWLPSFVLPRDPAIARVISAARRYLVTLQDDPTAGFDGYQSVDDSLDDPCESIDRQVQAIWTALVHEFRLLYINPPPAYSSRHQRLRTPSEIIGSNSGTCVDLALLLAACLEYIDIHPVIVLLTGHAFVGYWRSDEYHTEFRGVSHVPKSVGLEVGPIAVRSTISLVDAYGWRLAQQQYGELQRYLRDGKLRCLEATGLCFNYSFTEALEEGLGNMRAPDDFDSLIDVRLARLARPPVTPLPVIQMVGGAGEGGDNGAG